MVDEGEAGTIEFEEHDGVGVLRRLGEHDTSTVAALRASIDEAARTGDRIVVSLTETRFVDSSITHALYEADARAQPKSRRLVLHVAARSQKPPSGLRYLDLLSDRWSSRISDLFHIWFEIDTRTNSLIRRGQTLPAASTNGPERPRASVRSGSRARS